MGNICKICPCKDCINDNCFTPCRGRKEECILYIIFDDKVIKSFPRLCSKRKDNEYRRSG